MESVDADTDGQRSGDTHFLSSPGEVFFGYDTLDSPLSADRKVQEYKAKAGRVIEEGEDVPPMGAPGGVSYVLVEMTDSDQSTVGNHPVIRTDRYCLYWSKSAKYYRACSDTIQPIEHFRSAYEL
jgi:hypothetical protein